MLFFEEIDYKKSFINSVHVSKNLYGRMDGLKF